MGLNKPLLQDLYPGLRGPHNRITDVPGVRVGHFTLLEGRTRTGVTAVLPHEGNLFTHKVPAGAAILNGFGKSVGLFQIDELGTLETPVLLTNTLSVGRVSAGLVRFMLEDNPGIGGVDGTVNPVVLECNDGTLSDIRAMAVAEEHAFAAIAAAGEAVAEGGVGAGAGMLCYGLKGGIGTASRLVEACGGRYTLGCLVNTNFGNLCDLTLSGVPVGAALAGSAALREAERGSIIVVLATDAPLSGRQLKRIARRAGVGIARTGSFIANGSGEIALAFSTAQTLPHHTEQPLSLAQLPDGALDSFFRAAASAVEEAILSSLAHGETAAALDGTRRLGLRDALDALAGSSDAAGLAELATLRAMLEP